jgi:hypothetical protein
MPRPAPDFHQGSGGQIIGDEVSWHVTPSEAGAQEIMLRAQIVHEPVPFAGDFHLRLLGVRLIVGHY